MWESCRGFGKLICKNADNAGEGLPQCGVGMGDMRVFTEHSLHILAKVA